MKRDSFLFLFLISLSFPRFSLPFYLSVYLIYHHCSWLPLSPRARFYCCCASLRENEILFNLELVRALWLGESIRPVTTRGVNKRTSCARPKNLRDRKMFIRMMFLWVYLYICYSCPNTVDIETLTISHSGGSYADRLNRWMQNGRVCRMSCIIWVTRIAYIIFFSSLLSLFFVAAIPLSLSLSLSLFSSLLFSLPS